MTRFRPILLVFALPALLAMAAAEEKDVAIEALKFSPGDITITVGDTIKWTNKDDSDHKVTASDGSFESGNLSKGDTYSHKFTKAGKYTYSCPYHPRMKGTITVKEAS